MSDTRTTPVQGHPVELSGRVDNFAVAKLIFELSELFNKEKNIVISVVVSNIKNLDRRQRALATLVELIEFEKTVFNKIKNFDFEHADGCTDLEHFDTQRLKSDIMAIVNVQ